LQATLEAFFFLKDFAISSLNTFHKRNESAAFFYFPKAIFPFGKSFYFPKFSTLKKSQYLQTNPKFPIFVLD
jgi:hypothetical protein